MALLRQISTKKIIDMKKDYIIIGDKEGNALSSF
jgi:hypothetical protein